MATLDSYTVELDTKQALADIQVLTEKVDAVLIKIERVKTLSAELNTNTVTVELFGPSGADIAQAVQVYQDRNRRVTGTRLPEPQH